ncbi:uncharacterized protein LOC106645379 [Copidosoma floridanum]|uniref:uncharacterized protein LOC106645379 n=1 Tax=Copidosoma floridanum TaxID=29053 RepID=UPI0006C9DD17|nr:uncharacterized protein LOC106645379 [Copidosoma floridanum]
MWNRKVFIRIIELILCIACVVALRVTDDESRRVFHYLRNRSRERWSLLNNVTWGTIGAALATATCGGYTIVIAGLLIAAASGELRGQKTEKFLLGLGIVLFAIVGTLSLFSVDDVPNDLVDNAIIFGSLCIITAIVFIVDFLMSPVVGKKKHDGTQTLSSKEQAKQYVTTTTMTVNEKEPPALKAVTTWMSPTPEMTEKRNSANNDSAPEDDDRENRLERAERQMREYAQNIENGRGARGKQARDEATRKVNGYYRADDVYQRPMDEVDDAPPFPTHMGEIFPKVVNPGVKIMRVERDDEHRGYDNYRYSDSSQYDNVPTRMRGSTSSPGILKRQRDAFFGDQRRSRDYRHHPVATEDERLRQQQRNRSHPGTTATPRDEIEMLEDYFDGLRMSTRSTNRATQTTDAKKTMVPGGVVSEVTTTAAPISPNDPGFVRHTASNWPHSLKPNTPT